MPPALLLEPLVPRCLCHLPGGLLGSALPVALDSLAPLPQPLELASSRLELGLFALAGLDVGLGLNSGGGG